MKIRKWAPHAGVLVAGVTMAVTGVWLGQSGDSAEAAPEQRNVDLNPALVCSGPATVTINTEGGIQQKPRELTGSLKGTVTTCMSPNGLERERVGNIEVPEMKGTAGCDDQMHRFSGEGTIRWSRAPATTIPFDGTARSNTADDDEVNQQSGFAAGGGLDGFRVRTSFSPTKATGTCGTRSGIKSVEGDIQVTFLTPLS